MEQPEDGTRWLSEPEQEAWRGIVAVMWLLPSPLDAQLQRDSGLTLFEYFVLSLLSMAPGRRQRMRDLASVSNASPSRLSNVVNKLEARDWLRRSPDPDDRRGAVAELTTEGWDVVVAAAPGHVGAVRALVLDQLSAEQVEVLRSVGESLRGVTEPLASCSAPDQDDGTLSPRC